MQFLTSTIMILIHLKLSVGLQEGTQSNQVQIDIPSSKIQNQQYYYQHRPELSQSVHQQYIPVPIQMLQRSVYNQQPQAALIIVKAYPVYLTAAQSAGLQQGVIQKVHNVPSINYNERIPVQTTVQQPEPHPILISSQNYVSKYNTVPISSYSSAQPTNDVLHRVVPHQAINYVPAGNPSLVYASSPSNFQGDAYLKQLAQAVAQQYSKSQSSHKAPAIVTGLENFSAEQQKQIKNHLKSYIDNHSQNDEPEHREITSRGEGTQQRYSSRISNDQYGQQSEWRPTEHVSHNLKSFEDKS